MTASRCQQALCTWVVYGKGVLGLGQVFVCLLITLLIDVPVWNLFKTDVFMFKERIRVFNNDKIIRADLMSFKLMCVPWILFWTRDLCHVFYFWILLWFLHYVFKAVFQTVKWHSIFNVHLDVKLNCVVDAKLWQIVGISCRWVVSKCINVDVF